MKLVTSTPMATTPNKMPAKPATPKASKPTQTNKPQPQTGFASAWEKSQLSKNQVSPSDPRSPVESGNIQRNSSGDDVIGRLQKIADFGFEQAKRAQSLRSQERSQSTSNQQYIADRAATQQFNRTRDLQRDAATSQERLIGLGEIAQQNAFNRQMKAAENKTFTVRSHDPQELAAQRQMRMQREAMDRQSQQAESDRAWRSAETEKERAARAAERAANEIATKQSSESASANQKRMFMLQLAGRPL